MDLVDVEREGIEHEAHEHPVIRIVAGTRHLAIDAAVGALTDDLNLYQRNGALVHVTRVTEREALEFPALVTGSPKIHLMAAPTLGERLTRHAKWKRFDKRSDEWVPAEPTRDIVLGVLGRASWPGVRPLIGVIETPSLRPDGSVLERPGYDRSTGYLYEPSESFPRVPTAPSREDAAAALQELLDVFVDFPFEAAEGPSVAVAALLTLLARPAIRGSTPAFLFDAATPGTGKGLLTDAIAMITTGREAGKRSMGKDPRNFDEELRKVLTTCALRGARLIVLDNLDPALPLGGSSLEGAITSGVFEGRILGRSEDVSITWLAVVIGTGNNARVTNDMRRRTLAARLVSRYEDPSRRPRESYRYPDRAGCLPAWARSNRGRLVCAGLTVLRAYSLAGEPHDGVPLGSFEAWDKLIAGAIVWAGGSDPTRCLLSRGEAEISPERNALMILLRDLPRLDSQGTGITSRSLVDALWSTERIRGEPCPPDGFDDLRAALEELCPPAKRGGAPDKRHLGNALAKHRDVVIRVQSGDKLVARSLQHPKDAEGKIVADRTGVAKWLSRPV